uniref:RALY heterogeneous nuclear ribonucleoprotein n=1 Tax=Gasterosteus aculeatus aculeatus TaxID=481459 RepID=A0AAQ4NX17_GASAC
MSAPPSARGPPRWTFTGGKIKGRKPTRGEDKRTDGRTRGGSFSRSKPVSFTVKDKVCPCVRLHVCVCLRQRSRTRKPDINMAGEPRPSRPKVLKRSAASLYSGYELDCDYYRDDFYDRLFEYHGRVSPVPRALPVKRPRAALPLVRRVKSLPVRLLSRNASIFPASNKQRPVKGAELQAIKAELTQIKTNIEALLGRLEQITEDTHIASSARRKAGGLQSEELWEEAEESSSELEDEDEELRQNSGAEDEEEGEEEQEEEAEHTQDNTCDHMTNTSSEVDPSRP